MTKREQMMKAVADQKKDVVVLRPSAADAAILAAKAAEVRKRTSPPPKPPRERHPNDKLKARQRGHVQVAKGRLPHGSRFEATYDAEKERWFGTLAVYTDGVDVGDIFTADSKGVWRLMEKLDDLYRAFLATLTPTEEPK